MNDEPTELAIPEHLGLELLDYVAIVVYLVLTFGIAVWFGRKQKDTEDYFVGGRRMPWFVIGLSILATLFSTLTYQGVPGDVIKYGVAIFTGYLSLPLTFLVITFLWIPFFMRFKLTSAYEYLEGQFAKEFILENRAGAPTLKAMRGLGKEHQVEQVGAKLRDMMPWIKKNRLVDQSKN